MNKKLDFYNETLFHLINFRCRQFRDSRSMIGIDYDSFMICSVIGAHFLKHNTQEGANWDAVWETTRTKKVDENYKDRKLTIFAVANVLDLPKETVRRKIEILKNRLKERGAKYYDEPYLRFKGTKYEQETFFVKDPNENILEIKTLTANSE